MTGIETEKINCEEREAAVVAKRRERKSKIKLKALCLV